jgi:dUTP pyrophosphatase
MKIKFKRLSENAVLPTYAKFGDAGMDLVSVSKEVTGDYVEYGTGIASEIPEGYVGLLFPRSSISKQELLLCNSVGVLDSSYRGEIKLRFKRVEMANVYYKPSVIRELQVYLDGDYNIGDKIGQLVILPYPTIEPEWAEELSTTERGEGGFGSSGK